MKRLLLTILLLSTIWSTSFATDVIITTDGDVTAGTGRLRSRSTSIQDVTAILVGKDSASSTAHTMWLWYTQNDGATWSEKVTRPFTATGGFTSSELDPILTSFDTTSGAELFWALPPTVYSGSNMQARKITTGSTIGSMDTISPSASAIVTGLTRWTGDTLIYAYSTYDANLDDLAMVVVKSGGAWSQSVTWTAIDTSTMVITGASTTFDYCGSGVAIWDADGLDLYWIDGTVNDAIKTLGTNKLPALLSTTKQNATTMAVYHDSMIVVIGYLARDTSLWEYRWWATGGTRKTGLTLIDSTKLLNKAFFVGTAVDSTSPMPCLTGSRDGDTATLITRMWFNPSNTDSIVLGYSTAAKFQPATEAAGFYGTAGFDSANLVNNNISYGEGNRYRGLNCPRYYGGDNVMAFWQKGVSTPDSIYVSYENKISSAIEELTQIKTDAFSTTTTFQGTSEVDDMWLNTAAAGNNYGASTTLRFSLGDATHHSAIMRPLIKSKIPFPSHIVWCSLDVKIQTAVSAGTKSVPVQHVWKPIQTEGTADGADPGTDSFATFTAWNAGGDVAANNWSAAGGGASGGTPNNNYNRSTGGADRSAVQLTATTWTGWAGLAANTVKGKPLLGNFYHWQRYLQGAEGDSGWIRLTFSNTDTCVIYSSETATSTNGPKFYFNTYFTEPRVRINPIMKNFRRRYITPGFRHKKI